VQDVFILDQIDAHDKHPPAPRIFWLGAGTQPPRAGRDFRWSIPEKSPRVAGARPPRADRTARKTAATGNMAIEGYSCQTVRLRIEEFGRDIDRHIDC
jgi:hypothetical protein